jgi:hypothetical protein
MSTNASAGIISGTPELTVSLTGPQTAIFTMGGIEERLRVSHYTSGSRQAGQAAVVLVPSLAHVLFKGSSLGSAKRYALGDPIVPGGSTNPFAGLWENRSIDGVHHTYGLFGPGASGGFLGFVNPSGDLGWLQVKVTDDIVGFPTTLEAIQWAYNDVAGAPIAAGQTGAPEPGAARLALLALGVAGILALRKRRKEFAAK